MDNEILHCSISLHKFTYPIVLDCGHTFDKPSLDNLQKNKCPLCNMIFTDTTRINWIIVQLLNLSIEPKKSEIDFKNYTSKAMRELANKKNNAICLKYLPGILNEIKKKTIEGFYYYDADFKTDEIDWTLCINEMKKELRKMGYKIKQYQGYLHITW